MPAADLASLKIHDTARTRAGAGKFWGYFAATLGVLVLVAGGVFALKNRAPVVEVAVARPVGDPAQQTLLNASGYVTPRRRATVAAKITGRVTGVYFDEGDKVKEGQLLTTLEHLPEHCVWIFTTQVQGQRALFASDQANDVPALIAGMHPIRVHRHC